MADVLFILERIKPGKTPDCFQMWACRGAGKGCKRNATRAVAKHCDDCILPDENETVENVKKRLDRGDA